MLEVLLDNKSWGPLGYLAGKWVGARERRWNSGASEHMYEVRTFKRRPSFRDPKTGESLFPLSFKTRICEFYNRKSQVSEEMGYMIWRPESKLVTQVSVTSEGTATVEEATVELSGNSVWMVFNPIRQMFHAISPKESFAESPGYETTVIFDSSTYRFDLPGSGVEDRYESSQYRDVGELLRIGD